MKRILIIILVSVVVIGGIAGAISVFGTFSDGIRSGQIVKFSKKGIAFKTYEGQLAIRGFDEGDNGAMSNIWEFSVERDKMEVRQEIERAMEKGYDVRLHYKEYFFQFDWRGDTKYFVYDVEKVED
ncbi:MAG: 6-phosphogluconate dehydrogenase [Bacteroidota bacterium]